MSELEQYEKQFGKDAGYYRLKEKLDKIDKKYKLYKDMNIPVELQAKTIAEQNLYYFRTQLTNKCKDNNIELRVANRFYPSSKMCNHCGIIHKELKLKDRVFKCECGHNVDRDYNASCNLRDCRDYKVA